MFIVQTQQCFGLAVAFSAAPEMTGGELHKHILPLRRNKQNKKIEIKPIVYSHKLNASFDKSNAVKVILGGSFTMK